MDKIKKKVPNIITGSRIVSSIIAPILFLNGFLTSGILLYCYGVVSDFLDGYTARKFNAYSEVGRKMDAVSDKLFALAVIIPSLILGNLYMLIPLLLEGAIACLNGYYSLKGIKPRTIWAGKYKTVSLFPTMVLGLALTKVPFLINLFIPSLVISTKLQIQSICEYVNEYRSLLNKKGQDEDILEPLEIVKEEVRQKENKSTKEKLMDLKDEFVYYVTKDVVIEHPKKKVKILKL